MTPKCFAVIDRVERNCVAAKRLSFQLGISIQNAHATLDMLRRQAADEGEWR